jgi:hypothetical protein
LGSIIFCVGVVLFVLAVFGLADVKFVLRSLFMLGCSRLVLEYLPSLKIWYTFGIHSKKEIIILEKWLERKQTKGMANAPPWTATLATM